MAGEATARLRREASGVSRRSATRAGVFLGVAVLAAGATAVVLTRYMDARIGRARIPTTTVVVAAAELPVAATLEPRMLGTVAWPAGSEPAGWFSDPAALAGRVLLVRVAKGEPILASKLAAKDAGAGLAAVLPPDMRAVAVRVDDVVGVAGFIHPGDSVDVIVTMKPTETSDAPPTSKIILQNVKVLAVGKQVDAGKATSREPIQATVTTLMVDSDQAERLALAAAKGKLLLALRSSLDRREVATTGVIPPTLLAGPPGPEPDSKPQRHVRASRGAAPAPADRKDVVEILRGDRFEQRAFEEKGGRP